MACSLIFGVPSGDQPYLVIQKHPQNLDVCANHNFTKDHEPNIAELDNNGAHIDFGFHGGGGQFGAGADSKEAVAMRDNIAEHVW